MSEFIAQIRWRPQIGDPSFMGWFTVAAYAAAAILCFIAALQGLGADDPKRNRRRRGLWLGAAVLMLILCINKQLDLQSLFTDVGRVLARREGWYGSRRVVQYWFVLAVAAAGAFTLIIMAWKIRSALRENRVMLIGLASLITFIIIRAASFHHVDMFILSEILGIRVNWLLELGGIGLVSLGAAQAILRPRAG